MPSAGVEGEVKIGDQVVLREVKLDFTEQFRPHQLPQFGGSE